MKTLCKLHYIGIGIQVVYVTTAILDDPDGVCSILRCGEGKRNVTRSGEIFVLARRHLGFIMRTLLYCDRNHRYKEEREYPPHP